VPAVQTLRQIWAQQYRVSEGVAHWRPNDELAPAAQQVHSPYDPDARYGKKRRTTWVGYKVHLTETCEPDAPHLITQVETTSATTADVAVTQPIHDALQRKGLLTGPAGGRCGLCGRAAPGRQSARLRRGSARADTHQRPLASA
jgi:hypothetical protein